MTKSEIKINRDKFLKELRSGKYNKGCISSDENGKPIINNEHDDDGHCSCAIMGEMFGQIQNGTISLPKAMKKLGLTTKDCNYIQHEINDKPTLLSDDADRIEKEVFNLKL